MVRIDRTVPGMGQWSDEQTATNYFVNDKAATENLQSMVHGLKPFES